MFFDNTAFKNCLLFTAGGFGFELTCDTDFRGYNMAKYLWKNMFQPLIWQRGVEYYHDGRVLNLQSGVDRVIAEVEGSEIYTVSVMFNSEKNTIMDYSCDCPYGEDGTPCKHFAAVLYAIQDNDFPQTAKENDEHTVEELVNMLSEQQMRDLLIRFAKNNSFITETLQLTVTKSVPRSQQDQWELDLQELTDSASDRSGFIDYDEAYDYCCSLVDYMDDRLPDLLDAGQITEAFHLSWLVFQTGMEQEMDDSDGGTGVIAAYCNAAWSNILEQSDLENQKLILNWFISHFSDFELGEMFLNEYIYDAPWQQEIASEVLIFMDKQIQKCMESSTEHYRLNGLVAKRVQLMERIGESETEKEAYMLKYHHLPEIREIQISQAMREKDWNTALALLEESKEMDKDYLGLVNRYCTQIIEIYEKTNNKAALKKELLYYLHNHRQDNLVYVLKLKALLTTDEWIAERNLLLESKTMCYQVYPLLEHEKMYAQIMQRIENDNDLYALERFENVLKKDYALRCKNVLITHLGTAMDNASNRKAYWSVIQTLKKLRKYPDGKTDAQNIADNWKAKYPRRTSMLDELRKAGF